MSIQRKITLVVLALALSAAGWIALGSPGLDLARADRYRPESSVDLRGPSRQPLRAPELAADSSILRVAVAPIVSVERAYASYEPLAAYLGRCLGKEGKIIYRRSYAEVNDMVRLGGCDLAFVCTFPYVIGNRDFGMRALAVAEGVHGPRYRALILVPVKSAAKSLEDLKGKRFAYSDEISTGGWLYPATYLKSRGHRASEFFGSRIRTGSHDRAVDAVANGVADAAAADDFVFEAMAAKDPSLRRNLKVIQSSEWFGAPPVALPKQVRPEQEARIRRCLLGLHESAEGRRILEGLGAQRFSAPEPGQYRSIERLRAYLEDKP